MSDTIRGILEQRVAQSGSEAALASYEQGRSLPYETWSEHFERIVWLSNLFAQMGVQRHDWVIIRIPSSPLWQTIERACQFIGSAVIGVTPSLGHDQLAPFSVAPTRVWVISQASKSVGLPRNTISSEIGVWKVRDFLHGREPATWLSDTATHGSFTGTPHRQMARPGDVATLFSTSGTTGKRKLVAYTHTQVILAARAITRSVNMIEPQDTLISWLPLDGAYQRIFNLCAVLWGAKSCFVKEPDEIFNSLPYIQPALLLGVPRVYEKLAHLLRDIPDLKMTERMTGGKLKFMITGSAPIDRELVSFFHSRGLPLYEAYGITENIIPIAINTPGRMKLGSVGSILPENEVRFDKHGCIKVHGAGVSRSIFLFDNEIGSIQAQRPSRWLSTGDIGCTDSDGYLFLTGRAAHLIKTCTGRRISPALIETLFRRIEQIEDVCIFGNNQKFLVGLLTLKQDSTIDTSSLRHRLDQVNQTLAAHERVWGWYVLQTPFSEKGGEMTLSKKLRREFIEHKYSHELQVLYRQLELCGSPNGHSRVSCLLLEQPVPSAVSSLMNSFEGVRID